MLLMGFVGSPFRDFGNCIRNVVGLHEVDIWLILEQYNSIFVTYEIAPGTYSFKDNSEVVYTMGDHEDTLVI